MQKSVLLLKPQLLSKGEVGAVISTLEQHGAIVVDCTCMDLTSEDIYEYFELQVRYPPAQEVASFLGGMSLALAVQHESLFLLLESLKLMEYYKLHCVTDPEVSQKLFRFWFGGSTL